MCVVSWNHMLITGICGHYSDLVLNTAMLAGGNGHVVLT